MSNEMELSAVISTSLHENVNIAYAFPQVYDMTPQTIELFVPSILNRLHDKIYRIMEKDGDSYIEGNDAFGLSLHLLCEGVHLPADTLYDICESMLKKSRKIARWICPVWDMVDGGSSSLYYCKMYLDMRQDETQLKT